MRVAEHDPGASATRGIGNDGMDGKSGFRLATVVPAEVDAIQLLIQMRDEQALASRVGFSEAACEEVAGCCESVKLEGPFGTLVAHP